VSSRSLMSGEAVAGGRHVLVEVDGPVHFATEKESVEGGAAALSCQFFHESAVPPAGLEDRCRGSRC